MRKKIIFDMDDVLWDLNAACIRGTNICLDNIITYNPKDNPILCEADKLILRNAYESPKSFMNIRFHEGLSELVRLEQLGGEIYINSNSLSKEIADLKKQQLMHALAISESRLIFNVISSDSTEIPKKLPEDVFCLVDDSPYNIAKSTAKHNIMIRKPWNTSEFGQKIIGYKDVIYCNSLQECNQIIEELLRKEE